MSGTAGRRTGGEYRRGAADATEQHTTGVSVRGRTEKYAVEFIGTN